MLKHNGSLTSKTVGGNAVAYTYNLQNRLASVTTGGVTTNYKYDPQGIRVQAAITGGATTDYLIDSLNHTGYAQVLEEHTGSDVTTYTIGADVLAQATNSGAARYLLRDGHGSVRKVVGGDGASLGDYAYDAYGVSLGTSPTVTNLRYAGEMWDSTLGMYNLRARYYHPATGRFNQMDAFAGYCEDPLSLHKYVYVHDNPTNGHDPTGRSLMDLFYGQRVHDEIGRHFLSTGYMRYYDQPIRDILGPISSWWQWHRPDLADATTTEVWEIKPALSYLEGKVQLGWYLFLLNRNDPAGRTWKPGMSYAPPSSVKIGPLAMALVFPPLGGVITYEVIDPKPAIAFVTTYAISQFNLDWSRQSLQYALAGI